MNICFFLKKTEIFTKILTLLFFSDWNLFWNFPIFFFFQLFSKKTNVFFLSYILRAGKVVFFSKKSVTKMSVFEKRHFFFCSLSFISIFALHYASLTSGKIRKNSRMLWKKFFWKFSFFFFSNLKKTLFFSILWFLSQTDKLTKLLHTHIQL